MHRSTLAVLLLIFVGGCGAEGTVGVPSNPTSPTTPTTPMAPTTPATPAISATGTWTGVVGSQALSVTLVENSGIITGNGTLSNTPSGDRAQTVNGTFAAPTLSATMTSGTVAPINLQGTVTASTIAAALTGSGFSGDAVTLNKSGSTVLGASDWTGTWNLISVNGVSIFPANVTVLGFANRIFSRTLTVKGDGTATWSDSTLSALVCIGQPAGTLCNGSGQGTLAWVATGTSLKTVRITASGRLVTVKTFVKQPDGSLLKTDDSETEIYKKP